jgi:ribose transport system permease protein
MSRPDLLPAGLPMDAALRRPLPAGRSHFRLTYSIALFSVTAALLIVFSVIAPRFATIDNLYTVGRQIALTGIVAIGMTFVIVVAEIDLSVGSLYGLLVGIMAMLTINGSWDPWLSALLIIVLGVLVSSLHGLISTTFRVPSFIITLGGLSVYKGLYDLMTGGYSISGLNAPLYSGMTGGYLFGSVPVQVVWLVGTALIAGFVLNFTPIGYDTFAVGGNQRAAANVGVRVRLVKIRAFGILGLLVGIAAALNLGWLRSATPQTGDTLMLDSITAVILGGTNLFGGAGTIQGTVLGAFIIGMVSNALILLGVSPFWDSVAKGLIITVAALAGAVLRWRSES